ncbi:MAG: hypothetical protein KC464_26720, partial [Myxococcales bacterium]|nr:hypothetical protein [Myxococcales bacterium]
PDAGTTATAGDAGSTPPREPQAGDFDAGGKVRLPSGPDEMGQFATFNWIAVDLKGRYYLTRTITLDGNAPLAVKKPDQLMTGEDPRMIGGMSVTLDARLPKMPFQPTTYQTDVDLVLTGAYAREGALLLGEKDFPLFTGGFQPGFTAGAQVKIKLSSLIDFATAPVFVYQSGATDALTAVQIPTSTIIGLGSVLKVSADLDVMTGDDYSFSGAAGGRIAAGGSITLKVGPIMAHAGAGVASLLTGGMYPTIGDSVYVDLDVKYVK